MEERFGYYGITRRQRTIWIRVIAASCAAGLILVAACAIGLHYGASTLVICMAPLAATVLMFAAIMAWSALHGSPPRGPEAERERRERMRASTERTGQRLLWFFTVAGTLFLAGFSIKIVLGNVRDWPWVAAMGIVGVVWSSVAALGWWHTQQRPWEPLMQRTGRQ